MSNQIKTYHADVWIRSNGAAKAALPGARAQFFPGPWNEFPRRQYMLYHDI